MAMASVGATDVILWFLQYASMWRCHYQWKLDCHSWPLCWWVSFDFIQRFPKKIGFFFNLQENHSFCPITQSFYSLLTSQIRIRVGEYDFSHIQEEFPYVEKAIARKVVHPKYNFFTYEFDLALVKLDSPLEFAAHIAPICLPGTDDLLIGRNATGKLWSIFWGFSQCGTYKKIVFFSFFFNIFS